MAARIVLLFAATLFIAGCAAPLGLEYVYSTPTPISQPTYRYAPSPTAIVRQTTTSSDSTERPRLSTDDYLSLMSELLWDLDLRFEYSGLLDELRRITPQIGDPYYVRHVRLTDALRQYVDARSLRESEGRKTTVVRLASQRGFQDFQGSAICNAVSPGLSFEPLDPGLERFAALCRAEDIFRQDYVDEYVAWIQIVGVGR